MTDSNLTDIEQKTADLLENAAENRNPAGDKAGMSGSVPGTERTAAPDTTAPEDDYSLPLSAGHDSQWVPGNMSFPGSQAKARPLPEPGFSPEGWKEAGLAALILAFLGALIGLASLFGVAASIFLPFVLARLLLRRGSALALLATVAAFLADSLMMGLPSAAAIFLQYATMGFVFGYCYRKDQKPLLILLLASLCCLLGQCLSLVLSLRLEGIPLTDLWMTLEDSYQQTLEALASDGLLSGAALDRFIAYGLDLFHRLFLGLVAFSAMLTAALCYWLSSSALRRQGYAISKLPKFILWRVDWRLSWGLIIGLLLSVLGRYWQLDWMEMLGGTLSLIFGPILAVCGLAVLLWICKYLSFPGILKFILVVLLIILINYAAYLLIVLAVWDGLKNLRDWFSQKKPKHELR